MTTQTVKVVRTGYGDMAIVKDRPPIYDEAHKVFEIDDSSTVYIWGNAIYNPSGTYISQHVLEHESRHMIQQKEIGGPVIWWKRYLAEPEFRLKQELEAYGRQYWYFTNNHKNRNDYPKFLSIIAGHLSSDMYKCDISFEEAKNKIKEEAKRYN